MEIASSVAGLLSPLKPRSRSPPPALAEVNLAPGPALGSPKHTETTLTGVLQLTYNEKRAVRAGHG